MTFKKVIIFLFLMFSIIPSHYIFAQSQNVGIIPANIWYSQDPFQEGDKIKIYTVVYNSDSRKLLGTVIFFDNSVFLGRKDFSVAAKSTDDVWIDWTATAGDHVIYAKIENAKFLISEGKYEETYLAENKTEESKRTVSKKVLDELPKTIANKIGESTAIISNVGNIIKDNTPAVITDTVNSTTNLLESFRTNVSESLDDKKTDIKKEIDTLNNTNDSATLDKNSSTKDTIKANTSAQEQTDVKNSTTSTKNNSSVLKPLKYVELFFLTIFSFIFKYKIIFYSLLAIVLFLIIRYIWRLIF